MGAYINPRDCSKEEFLKLHGHELGWARRPKWENIPAGYPQYQKGVLPVILVDHYGHHSAAGIAYDKRGYEIMTNENDDRPRRLFFVKVEMLHKVCDELKRYLEITKKYEDKNEPRSK